ncbi:22934_t:CDS:2 [Rhizophagus irregularis]|nr:22934_t:CDS:2 [Rhizophagus irregularis]
MFQQIIRKHHSGNILKVIFRTTILNKKRGYITASTSARVLPDNIEIEEYRQLETENTLTIDDDNLMNQQNHSEPDNETSDEWKFLFEVYANLLKQSILACKKFKDPYLALSIFEQVKRRGSLSYQLGCTTKVYNQILLIRWEFWKDLKGIENLLNEMIENKISFDKETSDIIVSIELEVISHNNLKRWDSFDKKSYNSIIKLFENKEYKFQTL